MKKELVQKFYERWPKWFAGKDESVSQSLMPFGFDHGDGWFDLEWRLCEDLEKLVGEDYKLFQIKEKFGTLRWYDMKGNDASHARVREAEHESTKTCENCGKPGEIRHRAWWQTLCDDCFGKKNDE